MLTHTVHMSCTLQAVASCTENIIARSLADQTYPRVRVWLLRVDGRHLGHRGLNDHLQAAQQIRSMQLTQQPLRLQRTHEHEHEEEGG